MDLTIFTGRMSLAELKRDKPREYAALVASGTLEENPDGSWFRLDGAGPGVQHRRLDHLRNAVCVPIGGTC
jgi:hypothetical protein